MASPAEMALHYHCLNTSCVGLHGDTGIGATIFLSDTKYLVKESVAQFPEGCAGTAYTVLNFCFSDGLLG